MVPGDAKSFFASRRKQGANRPVSLREHILIDMPCSLSRAARRGMWKGGVGIEMPGEYKKRYSAALGGKEDVSGGVLSRLSALLK